MTAGILDGNDGISRRGALFGLGSIVGLGQGAANGVANRLVQRGRLPSAARIYLDPLGDRLVKPGRERSNAQGVLSIGTGPSESVGWTWENPGKLRLVRPSGRGTIVFDPDKPHPGNLDETSDEILEVLSSDTAENFFDGLQGRAGFRMLGERFNVKGVTGFGSRVDIFEYTDEIRARNRRGAGVKHFHFDSRSRLLARVAYSKLVGGRRVGVSTALQDYQAAGGYLSPRRIVRRQAGQVVFQVDVQTVQWTASAADNLFDVGR